MKQGNFQHCLVHRSLISFLFPYSPAYSLHFSIFPSIFFRFFQVPQHFLSIFPYSQAFSLDLSIFPNIFSRLSIFPSIFLRFFQTPPAFSFDLATLPWTSGACMVWVDGLDPSCHSAAVEKNGWIRCD